MASDTLPQQVGVCRVTGPVKFFHDIQRTGELATRRIETCGTKTLEQLTKFFQELLVVDKTLIAAVARSVELVDF